MNQQNIERECKEIGRDCAELPDIGIRGERIYKENRKITHAEREKLSGHIESWRRELIRCMDEDVLKLYKIYQKSKEEHEETKEKKWEGSRYRDRERTQKIVVEEVENQADLDWVSVSDASVGEAGTGVATAGCQRIKFQKEVLLQERHAGLGEIHGVYEQVKAAREHKEEVYVVCDCQGVVVALQNADYKMKFRKYIIKGSLLELPPPN